MGLGKTLEIIGLVLSNPATDGEFRFFFFSLLEKKLIIFFSYPSLIFF
jgi:hypothetical protein